MNTVTCSGRPKSSSVSERGSVTSSESRSDIVRVEADTKGCHETLSGLRNGGQLRVQWPGRCSAAFRKFTRASMRAGPLAGFDLHPVIGPVGDREPRQSHKRVAELRLTTGW